MKVISLGAGVQSTAMLLMGLRGEIDRADCAIFADTGWEPKAVYDHLGRLQEECKKHEFPLHVVQHGDIRKDALSAKRTDSIPLHIEKDYGTGIIRRQCTGLYKINPINKKIRSLLGYRPRQRIKEIAEMWIGITVDEAHRMKDNQTRWITNRYPLIDLRMDRHNCVQYLKRIGWGHAPKSACIVCPYTDNARWRKMKMDRPEEWEDAVDFDYKVRERNIKQKRLKGKVFLHQSGIPLDQVDFSTLEDKGQMNMFAEECEGMCGV